MSWTTRRWGRLAEADSYRNQTDQVNYRARREAPFVYKSFTVREA